MSLRKKFEGGPCCIQTYIQPRIFPSYWRFQGMTICLTICGTISKCMWTCVSLVSESTDRVWELERLLENALYKIFLWFHVFAFHYVLKHPWPQKGKNYIVYYFIYRATETHQDKIISLKLLCEPVANLNQNQLVGKCMFVSLHVTLEVLVYGTSTRPP